MCDLIKELINIFPKSLEIEKISINGHVFSTFFNYFKLCSEKPSYNKKISNLALFTITSILDYLNDELNTGHWSEVPITLRKNFTIATYLKLVCIVHKCDKFSNEILKNLIKTVDMGLLLGAPVEENNELLAKCAQILQSALYSKENEKPLPENSACIEIYENNINIDMEKELFDKIKGCIVQEEFMPSLEFFANQYFYQQLPVKLKGCIKHWSALKKWSNIQYFLNLAGARTVPIEIGSHYTDKNWSQKLMTIKEFIENYLLSENREVGYLAQHNLLDQIIELKDDIQIPEYCCCSLNYEKATDPDINIWLGPKETLSPLHQDPKNNILAQVFGTKQVILYSVEDSKYLYPYQGNMLSNSAQVDPLKPDFIKFPEFKNAKMYKCLLEPGDMLFLPINWWHHVKALDRSCSVSFWWQ
ncbi:bifunctional peptidase and arginyl-hydroxylase JMJD5 [Sitophilus oryzae]|uniref:Bifunctional peptidase and arginyl-hydroxylase JMJD5 n=1 Tax=Sitophilus oryzae TaxID=7048 RepID=A0A6J2YHM6_SITOR|nr:bifunctional peptidase and arginyl-hydroxylase JMJD5 [Sitophilus oryzae]